MCGRYSLTKSVDTLRQAFRFEERPNLAPRYNVAPGTEVAVVHAEKDGSRHLEHFHWGLMPKGWQPGRPKPINAMSERLSSVWRSQFRSRRCLVLADGFYEWQKGTKPKQPWRFVLADGAPFAMAGIYESAGGQANTLAIVTTTANATVSHLHDRMPVILDGAAADLWLNPGVPLDALLPLTAPFPAERMRGYAVNPRMNAPAVDDPGCAEPWSEEPAQPRLL